MGLPKWHNGKESACNARDSIDAGLIPVLEKSPGEGNGFGFPSGKELVLKNLLASVGVVRTVGLILEDSL